MTATALSLGMLLGPTYAADAQKDLPGPIDSVEDLQDTGKMLFKMADENNDGQISQQEAIDTGNLIVGGVFFRADADGNGTVSRQEMQRMRDQVLAQKPFLRILAARAQTNAPNNANPGNANASAPTGSPAQGILSLLDSNSDTQIQAAELKQLVQSSVQGLYAAGDTNRDGQMSPSEINAAVVGAARTAAQGAFAAADTDGNGQLSQAEYDKAVIAPANAIFRSLDMNNDSQISRQEAQTVERFLASQLRSLRVPEPANSPRRLIESGRTPGEVAPVPNFNATGTRPGQPAPTTPAPR